MTQITVPNVPTFVVYSVPTSSVGPFTVPFPFFDEEDVKATVIDIAGAETPLVVTNNFTFTTLTTPPGQEGTGYSGGAITLLVAIGATGTTIRIYRSTVIDRTANFPSTGPFSMPILNDEQNQQTMILQELDEANANFAAADVQLQAGIDANGVLIAVNTFNIAGNTTAIGDLVVGVPGFIYPLTAGEIAWGGAIANYGYPPGNILRYGTNTVPGTTDMLFAFNAAHDQFDATVHADFGGTVVIPEGIYYLSDTWHVDRQLHIRGAGAGQRDTTSATRLKFANDVSGIHFHSAVEPGYGSANNSSILDVFLNGGGSSTGHGLVFTDKVFAERVHVQDFAENGVHIFGGSINTTGTPNVWVINNSSFQNCGGNGIYVDGPDTNAGFCSGTNFKSNGGWGIYDSSFLGNTYIGCHCNDNAIGSVKSEGAVNENVFIGIYIEIAGKWGVELDTPIMWFGGVGAQVQNYPFVTISGDGTGAKARANVSGGLVSNVQVTAKGSGYTTATAVVPTGFHGSGSGALFTPNIVGGEITSVTVDDGGSGYAGNANHAAVLRHNGTPGGFITNQTKFRKRAESIEDGYLEICVAQDALLTLSTIGVAQSLTYIKWDTGQNTYNICASNSDAAASIGQRICSAISTGETGGRSVPLTSGSVEYPRGLWLGDSTTGRNISSKATMPTSGEYAKGDFVFNTNPSEAGSPAYVILGWSRLVTGTAHVLNTDWVEMRCVTGN